MKTKTITGAALCVAMVACLQVHAQKSAKVKEVGLGFSGLNNFSLQYRWGTEKKLYRLSGDIGGNTGFGKSSSDGINNNYYGYISNQAVSGTNKSPVNLNGGLNFSILKLNSINEKFGFMHGVFFGADCFVLKSESSESGIATSNNSGALFTYPVTSTYKTNRQTYSGRIGLALGAYYKINSSFLLYAEIDPNVYYAYSKTKNSTSRREAIPQQPNVYSNNDTQHNHSFGVSGLSNSYASLTLVYRINAKKA